MRTTILSIAIAVILSSCSKGSKDTEQTVTQQTSSADTSGLAEYQNWKAQKEQLQELDMNGITALQKEENNITPVYESQRPATKVIYRDRPVVRTPRVVRRTAPAVRYEEPVYTPTPRPTGRTREATSRNDAGVAGETGNNESVGTGSSDGPVVASTPVPAKKEGWSKAAKGTAIGAGSGAVLGAIISKNKAKGAVIGGVIGGVGGYVLGRSKDKKDGRYLVSN